MSGRMKEKDVTPARAARGRRTKKSDSPPKKAPAMLPGYVEARMVKCGKGGCKCARGELHGPYFYHFTWAGGRRSKCYVRRRDAGAVRAACDEYRGFQRELREGRRQWRVLLSALKGLGL